MMTDIHGCSTCPAGAEQWEEFSPSWRDGLAVHYDYRHTDGRLFSTDAADVEIARHRRNAWLARTGQPATRRPS